MVKYHFNRETGQTGKCAATFRCPLGGDLDKDHYSTEDEARAAFESLMRAKEDAEYAKKQAIAAKRLGDPILHPTSVPVPDSGWLSMVIDYDYDRITDHETDHPGDMCRCAVIENFRVEGWSNGGEDLANVVKDRCGIPSDEPLPDGWREKLQPYVDHPGDYDFEPILERGYYGEEFGGFVMPTSLKRLMDDFYYSRPNAGGPNGVLDYLRGKGYDTTGERPLEAIKNSLRAENNGKVSAKVEKARGWKLAPLDISKIKTPSPSQVKAGESDPRSAKSPYPKGPRRREIGGVVMETSPGVYELIDGYHRLAALKKANRRKTDYIILTASPTDQLYGGSYAQRWQRE